MPTKRTMDKFNRSKLYLRIGVALLVIYSVVVSTIILFQVVDLRISLTKEQEQDRIAFEKRLEKTMDHIKEEHEQTHKYIYCMSQAIASNSSEQAIKDFEKCGIKIEPQDASLFEPTPNATTPTQPEVNPKRKSNTDETVKPSPPEARTHRSERGSNCVLDTFMPPAHNLLDSTLEAL